MTRTVEILDSADFSDVPVIEINVSVWDAVAVVDPNLLFASDKATLDIPALFAGSLTKVLVSLGDLVSKGALVLTFEPVEGAANLQGPVRAAHSQNTTETHVPAPTVAYSDPEAKAQATKIKKSVFPRMATGRALTTGRDDGLTKRVLGAGIVGQGADDLFAEIDLAIEMGADAEDIALTVRPHPTLSESMGLAADVF